jgi:hypothetical protein
MYIANGDIFPALFQATGLGYCTFFGRISSMIAPMVVEADFNIAIWIFAVSSALSITYFLFITQLSTKSEH